MDDDEDIIAIDIVPELDESATRRSLDKLKDHAKDAGKSIGDSLKEAGHAGFDSLEQYAEKWVGDLGKTISSKGIPAALDQIGDSARHVTGTVADLGKALGLDLEGVRGFGVGASDAMGNVSKAVDSLHDALGGKLPKAIQDLTGKSDDFDKSLSDMQGLLGQVDGKLPGVAGHFAEMGKAALEAAAAIKGAYDVASSFDDWMSHHLPGTPSPNAGMPPIPEWGPDWMKRNPFGKSEDQARQWWDQHTPRWMHPFRPGPSDHRPAQVLPPTAPGPGAPGWNPALQSPTSPKIFGGGAGAHPSDFTHPTAPSVGGPEDLPGAGASVGNLFRFAQGLVGTPYSQALRDDCSGMVSQIASVAVGLPPPSAGGRFTTVNEGQRLAGMGFQPGMGGPGDLSIGWYDHGGGNAGHTAATLPGGINAESGGSHGNFALGSGAAGASSPQFDHHMYLPMGPGGRPPVLPQTGTPAGAGGISAHLTGFDSPAGLPGLVGSPVGPGPGQVPGPLPGPFGPASGATLPNVNQDHSYAPKDQPQMGTGKGFGLTGGGILGLLEQLPALAASGAGSSGGAMAPGAGAAGALAAAAFQDIAVPEMNLAAQKGGQMLATAAMAPIEEGWLGGGQMGAPSVGSPAQAGWTGKLLGSLVGTQFSMPNIAGAAAPPKDGGGQGQDQVNGGGGGDQGGKPGGKGGPGGGKEASPSGHQDDPIHVKNVGGQQAPPQGANTSAMNMNGVLGSMVA